MAPGNSRAAQKLKRLIPFRNSRLKSSPTPSPPSSSQPERSEAENQNPNGQTLTAVTQLSESTLSSQSLEQNQAINTSFTAVGAQNNFPELPTSVPLPPPTTTIAQVPTGPLLEDTQPLLSSASIATEVLDTVHNDVSSIRSSAISVSESDAWSSAGQCLPASEKLWLQAVSTLGSDERALIKKVRLESRHEVSLFESLHEALNRRNAALGRHGWTFKFLGRVVIIRDVVAKIVTWLQRFKAVGDLAMNFDPGHAAIPWAVFRFILEAITAENEQTGLLLIGMEAVARLTLRGNIYERLYLADGQGSWNNEASVALKASLILLYAKLLSLMAVCIKISDRNFPHRTVHALLNPGELSKILDDLKTQETTVDSDASNCNRFVARSLYSSVKAQHERIQRLLDQEMVRLASQGDSILASLKRASEAERGTFLRWISPIHFQDDHHFATAGRVSGTGEWLLQHPQYREWRDSSASTLFWLHGIRKPAPSITRYVLKLTQSQAGAGKTKLSSMVIDDRMAFLNEFKSHEGFAYFYCDRNREDHRDSASVLRCLVRQLSALFSSTDSVIKVTFEYWDSVRAKGFPSSSLSLVQCKGFLPKLCSAYSQTTIVIDGLDECDTATRHELLDTMIELCEESVSLVKVLIASRNDRDLVEALQNGNHLQVESNHNQGDIERFVLERIAQSKNSWFRDRMSDELKQLVLQTFRKKSQGMFQWAALQIEQLLKLKREVDVRAYLDSTPKGLKGAYDQIYHDITAQDGSGPTIAARAFQWVMASARPLSPDELVVAVCQDPSEEGISPVDTDITIDFVLEACKNLIVVTGLNHDTAPSRSTLSNLDSIWVPVHDRVCRLAHLSVQEYFEQYHWSGEQTQLLLSMVCLKFLTDPRLLDENSTTIRQFVLDSQPLIHYIYRPSSLAILGSIVFGLQGPCLTWLSTSRDPNLCNNSGASLLHLAARCGHVELCRKLIRNGANVDSQVRNGETPLYQALQYDHLGVAKFLIGDGKADPNLARLEGTGPLHLALMCSHTHDDVTKLMLENSADVNSRMAAALMGTGATPLLVAFHFAYNETTIKKLLELGADPNVATEALDSPLFCLLSNSLEFSAQWKRL
ncbi:hypothetical protein DL769_011203 [Monosporascus sp. CRB-8-3]|nr:hypothetical protein DL769_011203 [Monosporascus sp. CRB-8-3]